MLTSNWIDAKILTKEDGVVLKKRGDSNAENEKMDVLTKEKKQKRL